jgi:hypothetical protein
MHMMHLPRIRPLRPVNVVKACDGIPSCRETQPFLAMKAGTAVSGN